MSFTKEQILESLKKVLYFPKGSNVVDLDMVDRLTIEGNKVSLALVYPQANDKNAHIVKDAAERTLKADLGNEAEILIDTLSEQEAGRGPLGKVKNIIAIASGKGGVGKSTVASNLAIALAKTGAKVGLLDADIYGPSMPVMFGLNGERPGAKEEDGKTKILPIEKYGIKMLSIGFFIEAHKALMWRGSMASNALNQLFNDAVWGELDYLFIDTPPGTGDEHLTIVQEIKENLNAIIVTTPQNVAVDDVMKSISFCNTLRLNILGIVENMSGFVCPKCGEITHIFDKDGGKKVSKKTGLKLLGEIPLEREIGESCETGSPFINNFKSQIAFDAYKKIIDNLNL